MVIIDSATGTRVGSLELVSRKGLKRRFIYMAKVDYAFKSRVLKEHEDLIKRANKASLYSYAINQYEANGVLMPILRRENGENITSRDLLFECIENGLKDEYLEAVKINNARDKRTKRLKERIGSMLLNGDCLFLTLTFTDKTLEETSEETRRKFVQRYLKSFGCQYVANIDYGKTNHREHYHAVINASSIDFAPWRQYGNINAERVKNRNINDDKARLSKYISKLSNHAIKETTKRNSLIYSR